MIYIWQDLVSYLAVAQAPTMQKARELMLAEMGESGDGSCPERDKAREEILSRPAAMWTGDVAAFCLSDSAEVKEYELLARTNGQRVDELEKQLARLQIELAEAKAAHESYIANSSHAAAIEREDAKKELESMQCQALEACLYVTSIWDAIYQRGRENLGEMTIEQRGQSCLHGIAALREQLRDALREAVCAKEAK